ncbi:helix-turn-helix domain-containing protein [Endozoicomonas sp. SCSIO W0465]|uniref:helix-turn-helix domain-containing protein n=1 Tax=Endozoicomonas sp. SCSIO W0465 TaxID=2918516 RepID=UPI002074BBD9|nr:helix-turn-helix domain-containing protein [Endozoicomonas sp. SCSIO W0465]USE34512.1 helix-turn-helix domain-containing protein [Endozoicomonas sp. SCSIO W0465]
MLAHNPYFSKNHYRKVVDVEVNSGHLPAEMHDTMLETAYAFAQSNTDENGFNKATNMTRFFRRHTQLSPRQFRLLCRQNELNG